MNVTVDRWAEALDEFEATLVRVEQALDEDEIVSVDPWSPPGDLGVLPVELQSRATALSWRLVATEQRARDRRAHLRGELDDLARRRGAGAAYGAAGAGRSDRPV